MTRQRAIQVVVGAVAVVGLSLPFATPASAEPFQVCVGHDGSRNGYCVEVDFPPIGGNIPR